MRWLLVDSIEVLVAGKHIRGGKIFAPTEGFFQDHFPNFPVVPGVLMLESLAQLAGKLIGYTVRQERGDWPFPILSMMNGVKFRRFVRPGEAIELYAEMLSLRDEMAAVKVRARVGGKVTTQAEQIFVFNAVPLEDAAARDDLERLEFTYLRKLWPDCPDDLPGGHPAAGGAG